MRKIINKRECTTTYYFYIRNKTATIHTDEEIYRENFKFTHVFCCVSVSSNFIEGESISLYIER